MRKDPDTDLVCLQARSRADYNKQKLKTRHSYRVLPPVTVSVEVPHAFLRTPFLCQEPLFQHILGRSPVGTVLVSPQSVIMTHKVVDFSLTERIHVYRVVLLQLVPMLHFDPIRVRVLGVEDLGLAAVRRAPLRLFQSKRGHPDSNLARLRVDWQHVDLGW